MGRIAPSGPAESIDQARELKDGDRVRFRGESQARFKVRARGDRFVILTKPFNARHTVLYTVIDLELGIRGTDDYGGLGYETDEEIASAMVMFDRDPEDPTEPSAEISGRNNIGLHIADVKAAK